MAKMFVCRVTYKSAAKKRWRNDGRCGIRYPLSNGNAAECDPEGQNPCCSRWERCGDSADHCTCDGCIDYRDAKKMTDEGCL